MFGIFERAKTAAEERAERQREAELRQQQLEAERKAARASGDKLAKVMKTVGEEESSEDLADYRMGVELEAADELDAESASRCARGAKNLKISSSAFNHDVKVWKQVAQLEETTKTYDSDLRDLTDAQTAAFQRYQRAQVELVEARRANMLAIQAVSQGTLNKRLLDDLKAKNIRLYGTPAQVRDTATLHSHCFSLGIPH